VRDGGRSQHLWNRNHSVTGVRAERCADQPSMAYRIGQNLACASATSVGGSEPATMPQPAKKAAAKPAITPDKTKPAQTPAAPAQQTPAKPQ